MKNITRFTQSILPATLILTASGIISRLIGFYYRIFLNKYIGAAGIGLIQTIVPLITFGLALCVNGYASAISKYVASDKKHYFAWFKIGVCLSIAFSSAFSSLLIINSGFFSSCLSVLNNIEPLLILMACTMPISALHLCLNGLYFGFRKSLTPAVSQIIEQTARILCVIIYCRITDTPLTIIKVIWGNIIGESAACIYILVCLFFFCRKKEYNCECSFDYRKGIISVLRYSLPLNISFSMIHLFESCEAILVPIILVKSGLSAESSLEYFGIITGISIPIIMFPQALTNSFSVMLLPKISEIKDNYENLKITIENTIFICMHLGIFCTFLFIFYGGKLGAVLFNQPKVDTFVSLLAWICPFLYLKATLSSILNGLSKTKVSSAFTILSGIIRILFLVSLIPLSGIKGYMYSLLISNVVISVSLIIWIYKNYRISLNTTDNIIMPASISIISCFGSSIITELLQTKKAENITFLLLGAFAATIIYLCIFIKIYIRNRRIIRE